MKLAKIIFLVFLCMLSGFGALILYMMPPRNHPITLAFLGYGIASNGVPVAYFSMSNHSSQPVEYFGEGPSVPFYYLARVLFHDTNSGAIVFTNYHLVSTATTQATILPRGSVTFPVPMVAGTTDIKVGVQYLPRPGPVRALIRDVQISLTRRWSESYVNVELQAPFR